MLNPEISGAVRIPPFAAEHSGIIFWVCLVIALFSIYKTKKSDKLSIWDAVFLLGSWQSYNLLFWEYYLSKLTGSSGYFTASAVLVGLSFLFAYRRGIAFNFRFNKNDFLIYLKHFAALTILIPTGLLVGFLSFHPVIDAKSIFNNVVHYFGIVAPNEEFIFRGILFNLLAMAMKPWQALLVSTGIFSVIYTHLSGEGSFPNWTYVGFAFVAGLGYGHSYLKSKSLTVPILLHGTVDTIWRLFLSGKGL